MKNHLKFIKIALSIIVISLYNSCRHEDALFPYTQQGLNRASFLLDNRAHKIDNVSYGDNFFFSYMSNDSNLYGVLLYRHTNFGVYFYLNDIQFKLGRIDFKTGTSAVFIDSNDNNFRATKGYIDIKSIDSTDKYKRILAGEFEFDAWNSKLSKTVHINRGNFDSKYVHR